MNLGKELAENIYWMLPHNLTHVGKSLTLYKDLLPGEKKILFAWTNGHIEWQVTHCTKFRQVAKEKEKRQSWSVTDELHIHHPLWGKQLGELLLLSATLSLAEPYKTRLEAKHIAFNECPTTVLLFNLLKSNS